MELRRRDFSVTNGASVPRAVSATRHTQKHVTILDGIRIRYIDVGVDDGTEPPLLLLHGLASRIEEYEQLVAALKTPRRIIVLDLPGNGYSDKPNRSYSLTMMEDAALALLDELGVQRANVGGGSLGGNLTLRLGLRQPERFGKLAAWGPAGAWEPKRVWPYFLRMIHGDWLFWPMIRVQSRFWYHPSFPGREEALLRTFAHFREVHCPGFVRMYYDLGFEQVTTSLFPVAPNIRQPTLLLWGDKDNGLGMAAGVKKLASLIPGSRLVVFEGARHSLADEVPVPLAQSIDAFLTSPPRI
jgi:pimeloyl-ACP methyl ester carboxylesterase